MKRLLPLLMLAAACAVQAAEELGDDALAAVSGRDGVNIALHLALNDPAAPNPVTDSRLTYGFQVDGKTTYMVVKNLRGTIDVFGLALTVHKKPDGSDYTALTLPEYVKFGNFGYESFSVQADPLGPVTDSLGRVNVNGTLSMQGQVRLWAH